MMSNDLLRFGCNPYGSPMLRLMFSPRVPRIVGGYWQDHGVLEYRRHFDTRKHWILEKWFPARFWGDPRTWIAQGMTTEGYLSNGPYPYRGKYLEVFRFETKPAPGLVLFAARQAMLANTRTRTEIRRRLEDEKDRELLLRDREIEDMLSGIRMGTMQTGASGRLDDADERRFWQIRNKMNDPSMLRDAPTSKFQQGMEG
jgi:hypothetical protein